MYKRSDKILFLTPQDANEEEIIQRVDELTEARLKEAFPEFYLPKPQAKQVIRHQSANMERNAEHAIRVFKMSNPSRTVAYFLSTDVSIINYRTCEHLGLL